MHTVLVIERDPKVVAAIRAHLEPRWAVTSIDGSGDVVQAVRADPPDGMLLALDLPDESGLSVCNRVREFYTGPILLLGSRQTSLDEIIALELGADAYFVWPLNLRLLELRLSALLRVGPEPTSEGRYADADLEIDRAAESVKVHGEPVTLPPSELDLLWLLVENIGRPVTREMYCEQVRGVPFDGLDRSLDTQMSRLRKALEVAGLPEGRICTVRATGYQLTRVD
ncbi:MAG: response regulator transcription factor [Alphaproteobacteria bacterium]|nr:response regulator transcription factor [Alphaproteobacteria bacterium]